MFVQFKLLQQLSLQVSRSQVRFSIFNWHSRFGVAVWQSDGSKKSSWFIVCQLCCCCKDRSNNFHIAAENWTSSCNIKEVPGLFRLSWLINFFPCLKTTIWECYEFNDCTDLLTSYLSVQKLESVFSFFMYNSKKKSVMVIIQEADVITTWVKARNRKDWGKIKSCCKYQKPMPVCQLLVKEPTVWHICYVDRAVIYTFP